MNYHIISCTKVRDVRVLEFRVEKWSVGRAEWSAEFSQLLEIDELFEKYASY